MSRPNYNPNQEELMQYWNAKLLRLNGKQEVIHPYMSASQLKRLRNWTDSAIKAFLPSPTLQPIGPRKSAVASWSNAQIQGAERSSKFLEWMFDRLANQYNSDLVNGLTELDKNIRDLSRRYKKNERKRAYWDEVLLECEVVLITYPIFQLPQHDLPNYPLALKRNAEQQIRGLKDELLNREKLILRPTVSNPTLWSPERPNQADWQAIRSIVLERDDYTCQYCGHRAIKYMNVHHVEESEENDPDNLVTCCVACHAIQHVGRNLSLGKIEIWQTDIPQVDIVRRTREGIKNSLSLNEINDSFNLQPCRFPPDSVMHANSLIGSMGDALKVELPENLCAVFVEFERWQLD